MKSILWSKPDGSAAFTALAASDADSQEQAAVMIANGVVPPDWVAAEFDVAPPNPPAVPLAQLKPKLVAAIDDRISAIYQRFTRFDQEYVEREKAAQAFKDGGYQGDPGIWVSAFADNSGKTAQEAADVILAQAAQLRGALESLGAQRMRKYGIQAASSKASAQAIHDDIIAQADAIGASLE